MFELTDLVCKTHPGSKITGDPGWFPMEGGKWVWDTTDVVCSHWSSHESCVFTFTVTVEAPPGTKCVHKLDETEWA
jgi:hypothetical protein